MEFKTILKVGFKVAIAAVTGLAIYVSMDKVNNNSNRPNRGGNRGRFSEDNNIDNRERRNNEEDLINDFRKEDVVNEDTSKSKEEVSFSQRMRNVQNTFSKLLAFAQTVTVTVDSISKIFNGNDNIGGGYGYQQYIGNPYEGNKVYLKNGAVFNRLSPYILELDYSPYDPNNQYNGNAVNNPYSYYNRY